MFQTKVPSVAATFSMLSMVAWPRSFSISDYIAAHKAHITTQLSAMTMKKVSPSSAASLIISQIVLSLFLLTKPNIVSHTRHELIETSVPRGLLDFLRVKETRGKWERTQRRHDLLSPRDLSLNVAHEPAHGAKYKTFSEKYRT